MARKRYSDEDALKVLREIDVHLHDGLDRACAYYYVVKNFNVSSHNSPLRFLTGLGKFTQ